MRDNGEEEEEAIVDEESDSDSDEDGDGDDDHADGEEGDNDVYSQTSTHSEAEASDSSNSAPLRRRRRRRCVRRRAGKLGLKMKKQKPTGNLADSSLLSPTLREDHNKHPPKLLSVCLIGWDATDAKLTFLVTLVGQIPNLRVSFAGDVDVRGAVPDIPDPRLLEDLCKRLLARPLAVLNGSDAALPEEDFSSALKWLFGQVDQMRARVDDLSMAAEKKHAALVDKKSQSSCREDREHGRERGGPSVAVRTITSGAGSAGRS